MTNFTVLSPNVVNVLRTNSLVLDLRIPELFERGYIPGSLNIGNNGDWEEKLLSLVEKDRSLLLLCPDTSFEVWTGKIRALGYTEIQGVLIGGFDAWLNAGLPYDMIISITPEEFWMDFGFLKENEKVIDVRTAEEVAEGTVFEALSIPLESLWDALHQLSPANTYYIYCSGGYRSMIAASILKMNGIPWVKNVLGGYTRLQIEKPTFTK
jgi:hydroxyacylglutathione hydrolase